MADQDLQLRGDRFLASGDESGTAPGDRPFRPDVEGLRAVAVLLVVLFHSGVSLSGGYIGVDVFFAISGFVITGLLLRERASSGKTSILAFYGRRCRRIIPAATLVIIITVTLSYFFLGRPAGARTAIDGRWAAVFLANFHFTAIGTDYLGSQLPPSPLQNFWSLAVEEQFYLIYPTLFLLVATVRTRLSLRTRLAMGLVVVIGTSLAFSVLNTASNPTASYFSPLTRAWELALGALVAVATPWLLKVPAHIAATATWLGLGAIVASAFAFSPQTAYPGSLVTIPVVGAALIIAGGVRAPRLGAEALLGLAPFRGLGKLSYSLYLWHWPILIVAAEYVGKTSLSVPHNLGLDLVALLASAATYLLVENPIRHAKALFRIRWASVGLGVGLVALTLAAIAMQSNLSTASRVGLGNGTSPTAPASTHGDIPLRTVLRLVAASNQVRKVPSDLSPSLFLAVNGSVYQNLGIPPASTGCWPRDPMSTVPMCKFGDPHGKHVMVLYGDSHAGMWFQALDDVAKRAHWTLDVIVKGACSAAPLPVHPLGVRGDWVVCDQWHRFAINRINRIKPNLLIVSQNSAGYGPPSRALYTPTEMQRGLEQLLKRTTSPTTATLVIGGLPEAKGPVCLAQHLSDVQACSVSPRSSLTPYDLDDRLAAVREGARYVDIMPWFCTKSCSSLIGNYSVFWENHVALNYSLYLRGVLGEALNLSNLGQVGPRH